MSLSGKVLTTLYLTVVNAQVIALAQGYYSNKQFPPISSAVLAKQLYDIKAPSPVRPSRFTMKESIDFAFDDAEKVAMREYIGANVCLDPQIGELQNLETHKNYVKKCFLEQEHRFYRNSSARLKANPKSNTEVEYTWDNGSKKTVPKEIAKNVISRVASRTLRKNIKDYPYLEAIVLGQFDVNFSLKDIYNNVTSGEYLPKQQAAEVKPQYVLNIEYETPSQKYTRIALANEGNLTPFFERSKQDYELMPEVVSKKIIEAWPEKKAEVKVEKKQTTPQDGELNIGQLVQRNLGLADVPYIRYKMRIERVTVGIKSTITLKLSEINDYIIIDPTEYLLTKNKNGFATVFKIPYYKHLLRVEKAKTSVKPFYGYGYTFTALNTMGIGYSAETKSYLFEFRVDL